MDRRWEAEAHGDELDYANEEHWPKDQPHCIVVERNHSSPWQLLFELSIPEILRCDGNSRLDKSLRIACRVSPEIRRIFTRYLSGDKNLARLAHLYHFLEDCLVKIYITIFHRSLDNYRVAQK